MLVIEIQPNKKNSVPGLIPSTEWQNDDNQSKEDFYEGVLQLIERHEGQIVSLFATGPELIEIENYIINNTRNLPYLLGAKKCYWHGDHANFLFHNFFC